MNAAFHSDPKRHGVSQPILHGKLIDNYGLTPEHPHRPSSPLQS
jgi:hypothetical protein